MCYRSTLAGEASYAISLSIGKKGRSTNMSALLATTQQTPGPVHIRRVRITARRCDITWKTDAHAQPSDADT